MINNVTVQGRLSADPVMRQTKGGKDVCSFTVIWSEKFGQTENKLFLRCTAWKESAQFVTKYFRKGQEVVVEGKLTSGEFEKDGVKKQTTDLTLNKIHFCGPKSTPQVTPQDTPQEEPQVGAIPDDDSIPF